MKTNFLKNYKKLLVIWIACGILVSGYFYIFPVKTKNSYANTSYDIFGQGEAHYGISYYYEKGKHFEVSLLVTVVGSLLIGGLGYTSKTKE